MSKRFPYARGVWLSPDEGMPKVEEHDDGDYSEAVLIRDNHKCLWLARWDGEVWRNANTPDKIYFNKEHVVQWFAIPK